MTRFKITAYQGHTWEADTNEEFLEGLRGYTYYPSEDQRSLLRGIAAGFCDWTGESIRFSSISHFIEDSVKHGCLEVSDAGAQ